MRIAAVYDIHGNLPALEAVLADVARASIDLIIVGGDVVPGPMPVECLERVLALPVPCECIHGNGERAVLEQMTGRDTTMVPPALLDTMRWVAAQVTPSLEAAMRAWPATIRHHHHTLGDVLFCHATPRNDTEIFTRNTPEPVLRPIFDEAHAQVVVVGHTHMQFDRMVGTTRVLNAGSVGMPFGGAESCWLMIDESGVTLRKTAYDVRRAAAEIGRSSFPGVDGFIRQSLLDPPSEETMLNLYRNAEIGASKQ